MKKLAAILMVLMMLAVSACAETPTTDRAGNSVTLPEDPQKVICLSSSANQTLESLGLLDRVIAVDTYTPTYIPALAELPQFDMMAPDVEQIALLEPDLIIVTGMALSDGTNPYQPLIDMGVCIAIIPSSESIQGIKDDIAFIASIFGVEEAGQSLIDGMQATIDEVSAIAATITEKKSVFFEISAMPYLYSFGTGTFLDEMLTLVGAENVMADQAGWVSVTEEDAVAANPDVILTCVNYIEDPVGEIMARPGWENVTAVANSDVHYITNDYATLSNEHVVKGLVEIALAVYPDAYAALAE
jgi:iron complex transport system substrate-binding protein